MCHHTWQPWSSECIGYRDLCVTAQYCITGLLTLGIDRCCCKWCDMQFQCAGWPAICQNTRQFAKQLLCMGKNQSWAQAGGVYNQRQRAAAPHDSIINQDQSATWLNCTALCLSSTASFVPAYEPLTTILCYPCLQCTFNAQQLPFTACLLNAIFVL